MKQLYMTICALSLLLFSADAYAASFDAVKDYSCTENIAGTWELEAYRADDGKYLSMVFGHAPLKEVSKYGIDAHYLPDGDQPYYPFVTKFGDVLVCSPATSGKRYDAVIAWVARKDGGAVISGMVKLLGDMYGHADGKKVRASVLLGGRELWAADVTGGAAASFRVEEKVRAGDRVRLHITNTGDSSGNISDVDLHVETAD
ncbi:MAG: hypothetical protein HZA22_01475 [Nitrospirae bacterium]|nr:hypothetical protein [Nitrospirota bacterium]MBI5696124.1 hypothetical protein [Nitrospirota bacterium]